MSVLLKAQNGNELELGFIRESLADVQDAHGDSSWCTVTCRAATSDDEWEESSPCLNLFEFQTLAEWLESVGTQSEGEVEAVELLGPDLSFTVSQQEPRGVSIRVGFHVPRRPEEDQVDAEDGPPGFLDLYLSREAVRVAAAELRRTLADLAPSLKDDTLAEGDGGLMGEPDENLNMVDRVEKDPPGAGRGEDNAGNR